jgi:hypothetical protein
MPIVFEEVTAEVAPQRGVEQTEMPAPAADTQQDLREKLQCQLILLRERQARLFAD